MAQRRPRDQRVVRNRRVAIYTFLLILTLFYISAHRTVQKEREMEALRAETAAEGPGEQVKELAEGWPEEVVGGQTGGLLKEEAEGQTGGQPKEPVQEQPEGLPGARVYKERGEMDADEGLKILPEDMWCLILTNAEYPVPEDYEVELEAIPGTEQSVDKRIYEPLMAMIGDMKAQGLSPIVCSGYRTLDKQEKLFNRKVLSYVKAGHTKEESYNLARQTISIPGSGEHCLGLAVDFYTRRYHKLERAFEDTPESKWLVEHAQDYGFVMRYGENKTDITGIQYEPWHYRYVGVEAANYMKDNELSLEEFYIEQSLYG
ncbi:M15 family metallopeptidase [Enterocloster bolteae]|uniref:M15 family metallopeptidase n=1 Tax=Enterocloster bolteae TaxID=208479 RepID=UPI00210C42BA|nr:M15 family metallopeptidase [Enterocloster bolteae]MCQ5144957.1 D-alanyl-D-alanine carboxypeptidase family protein [Enterocloster bolteae]